MKVFGLWQMMSPNSLFDGGEGLCGLNENHQTAKDRNSLLSLAIGLWFDPRKRNEYQAKD